MKSCCVFVWLLLPITVLEANYVLQTGDIRLVNGNKPNNGRVEIYYDGQWGTVCDDNWGLEDALVVCRMMGFANATRAVGNAEFGSGSGPILLDDVTCKGTEVSLASCNHKGWRVTDCSHSEDAGVECETGTDVEKWSKRYSLDKSDDFSEALGKLYDSKWHCDFHIRVMTTEKTKNTTICTHQLILAMNTDAEFLLKNNVASYTMKVTDECFPYVDDFISYSNSFIYFFYFSIYLYSKRIEISLSSARCIHQMASLYGIKKLQEFCTQILSQLLPEDPTFKSQVDFLSYAFSSQDGVLQELCLQYLAWNCETFINSPLWLDLSAQMLQGLLSRSDIIIHSERTLLEALQDWILAHNDTNSRTVKDLISRIRFPMILPEELFDLKFTIKIYSIYEKLFQRAYQQASEFHTVSLQRLRQYVNLSDSSYIPRIYTSSAWSYLYNSTGRYSVMSDIYHYRYDSSTQSSFTTAKHTSFLYTSQKMTWTSFFFSSAQQCRNSFSDCRFDTSPVLALLQSYVDNNIEFQNKAVLICKNSYISDVLDFKNNFAAIPANNLTFSSRFPCDSMYSSFRYVIRPLYISNNTYF
ncbi:galectin-3-binding protein-like [Protopterus annectens]|uniref:galectin-3-binding protein-like n=1 Tax=Protopterus annectens TaxID=7888 RepID=UPI001CFA2641|nr:galectin-3-binding protein-like [Protopterus annectens]